MLELNVPHTRKVPAEQTLVPFPNTSSKGTGVDLLVLNAKQQGG